MMEFYFVLLRYLVNQKLYVKLMSIIQSLVAITILYYYKQAGCEGKLMQVSMRNNCVCPGDIVMYECTVFGDPGGLTVWVGDFFHCSNGRLSIELVHSWFYYDRGGQASNIRICNNGNITARIVSVENGSYTSQLNVTLTSDIAGKTIECAYDNGTVHRVGSLNITAEFITLSPGNISWTTYLAQSNMLIIVFNWNNFENFPDCPAIHYNILASNCGSCPTTTNYTNVTCVDASVDQNTFCTFALQTVCGILSHPVNVPLSANSLQEDNIGIGSQIYGYIGALVSVTVLFAVSVAVLTTIIIALVRIKTTLQIQLASYKTTVKYNTPSEAESKPASIQVDTRKNIAYEPNPAAVDTKKNIAYEPNPAAVNTNKNFAYEANTVVVDTN